MPIVSEKQRRAMWAAENGHSNLGIPKSVAEKFLAHDFASLAANSAIPANLRKLAVDADTAQDMEEADWRGLIDGLVKFFLEEAAEPEHAADAKRRHNEVHYGEAVSDDRCSRCAHFVADGPSCKLVEDPISPDGWCELFEAAVQKPKTAEDVAMDEMAMDRSFAPDPDSRFVIAQDLDSVREKTREGRLIVKRTHITKANVCPYRGKEIPGWKDLGLEPEKIYNLLRDPEELRKAVPTLNGVQLLIKHRPVSADDHAPYETVGSLGSDAEFDGEYLDNSLYVNAQKAIDAIERGKQRELSAGYHYMPDMTPGVFGGKRYDGVMRDIAFNHVALVEDGRAGPDVVVADEALKESDMAKATRFGVRTLQMTAAAIAPLLAMDSKATLAPDLFRGLTTKNFKDNRDKLLAGVRTALVGAKLRPGIALDASMKDFAKAIDAFKDDMEGIDEPAPEDKVAEVEKIAAVEPAKGIAEQGSTYDAEPLKNFLREKGLGEDDIAKACDMMPKPGMAGDEDDDDDKGKKDVIDKPAMDAALKAQGDAFEKRIAQIKADERGVRQALADVKPYVGEMPATMAFDTAADVLRHALVMRNVDGAKTMHADALLPILKTLPKVGARPAAEGHQPALAMDSVEKARKLAPGIEHISTN